jgi:hypothetical protein
VTSSVLIFFISSCGYYGDMLQYQPWPKHKIDILENGTRAVFAYKNYKLFK